MMRTAGSMLLCLATATSAQGEPAAVTHGGVSLHVRAAAKALLELEVARAPAGPTLFALRLPVQGAAKLERAPYERTLRPRRGSRETVTISGTTLQITVQGRTFEVRTTKDGIALREARANTSASRPRSSAAEAWTLEATGIAADARAQRGLPLAAELNKECWVGLLAVDPAGAKPFSVVPDAVQQDRISIFRSAGASEGAWLALHVVDDPAKLPFSAFRLDLATPVPQPTELPFTPGLCAPLPWCESGSLPAAVCERSQQAGCRYVAVRGDDADLSAWLTAARHKRIFVLTRFLAPRLAAMTDPELLALEKRGVVGCIVDPTDDAELCASLAAKLARVGLVLAFAKAPPSDTLEWQANNIVSQSADPWLASLLATADPTPAAEAAREIILTPPLRVLADESAAESLRRQPREWDRTLVLSFTPGISALLGRRSGVTWSLAGIAGKSGHLLRLRAADLGVDRAIFTLRCDGDRAGALVELGPFELGSERLVEMPVLACGGFVAAMTPALLDAGRGAELPPVYLGSAPTQLRVEPADSGVWVRWQDTCAATRWWVVERDQRWIGVTREPALLDRIEGARNAGEYTVTPFSALGERGVAARVRPN